MKGRGIDTKRRRMSANRRKWGDSLDQLITKHTPEQIWTCKVCGSPMSYWKEDHLGDIIMSCNNECCYKSKDFAGSLNVELARLAKQQQMNSRLYYKNYLGGYH